MDYNLIKRAYEEELPRMMEYAREQPGKWYRSYLFDWMRMMSPIEQDMWVAIRCFGKLPLYPQFPVGKHFVDFGNPQLKIAIECDGMEFHTDKQKDAERTKRINAEGWTIYRVTGSECKVLVQDQPEETGRWHIDEWKQWYEHFYLETIEGLLKALAVTFMGWWKNTEESDKGELFYFELAMIDKCLEKRKDNPF